MIFKNTKSHKTSRKTNNVMTFYVYHVLELTFLFRIRNHVYKKTYFVYFEILASELTILVHELNILECNN